MAQQALLERHLLQEIVDVDGHGLLHHAVEGDGPGPDRQRLSLVVDLLLRAELVEVVVVLDQLLVGHRTIEREAIVVLEWIEPRGRIFRRLSGRLGERGKRGRRHRGSDGAQAYRLQEAPAIVVDRLWRRLALGDFPAALPPDQHYLSPDGDGLGYRDDIATDKSHHREPTLRLVAPAHGFVN